MRRERNNNLSLPDFIVIGAQKAGTSSMYNVLSQYAGVQMASRTEVSFFDLGFQRGLAHYQSFFKHAEPDLVMGEVSPGYLYFEPVPKRIAECLPQVKLIASLRNPVQRAFSAWRMQISKGSETRPFSEAVRENPIYLDYGRYYQQLSRYYDLFPSEQILVLLFDDLQATPDTFFSALLEFIEVDANGLDTNKLDVKDNIGGDPRWYSVTATLNTLYRMRNAVRKTPAGWLVDNRWIDHYSRRIRNNVAAWNRNPKAKRYTLDQETAEFIIGALAEDTSRLSTLIGRDVSHWMDTTLISSNQ